MSRQIILDTETTGLDPTKGHKIIEIGCVELINRKHTGNNFHCYINPQRTIDQQAIDIHGITEDFLQDKPIFADVAQQLLVYLSDSQLIAHNMAFDSKFLNHEFNLVIDDWKPLNKNFTLIDTLKIARKKYPGQRNSLDALCKRYNIDNQHRQLHGALLDAQLLAEVYLSLTGGQTNLFADMSKKPTKTAQTDQNTTKHNFVSLKLPVIYADYNEQTEHQRIIETFLTPSPPDKER